MSFYSKFIKETSDPDVSVIQKTPTFFLSTGNFCLNKIISGSYDRGYAQGRMTMLAGLAGAGKSFLAGNAMKQAQDDEYGILVVDSENSLDEDYLKKIGIDVDAPSFLYRGVKTISKATEVLSKFYRLYKKDGMQEKFLVVVDSLDMLQTDSVAENWAKGETKGDQGQQAKQLRALLGGLMHDIKDTNTITLCTKQVYMEQDPNKKKYAPVVVTPSLRFPFSQIGVLTNLVLRDEKTKQLEGITLKFYADKTRFTKPFQNIKLEVPYDTGIDPYSGILLAAEYAKIVAKAGSWYTFEGNKFQGEKGAVPYYPQLLEKLKSLGAIFMEAPDDDSMKDLKPADDDESDPIL